MKSDRTDSTCAADGYDQSTIDELISNYLSWQPQPHVLAVNEHGVVVPMPASVPVERERCIEDLGSAFELCIPDDNDFLIKAFMQARSAGGARTSVHLLAEPQAAVTLHMLDARHRYDVILVFLIGADLQFTTRSGIALVRPRCFTVERDQFGVFTNADEAVSKILGWPKTELIGMRSPELIHPADSSVALGAWMQLLARPAEEASGLYRYRHRDGSYVWLEATSTNLLADPLVRSVRSQMVDVSDRMAALEALALKEELLRRLTDALPVGIMQIDREGRIVYRNERLTAILGAPDGVTIDDQFRAAEPDERAAITAALGGLSDGAVPPDLEITVHRPQGIRRCGIAVRPLCAADGSVSGAIVCVSDITDNSRLRSELERRATVDALTGCRNRASIIDALQVMVAPGQPNQIAVMFIDLDGFKRINDDYGHAAGDELLRCVGRRLLDAARAQDLVGRLGGDEFLVLCQHVNSAADALAIATRLHAALGKPALLGAQTVLPSASIGVAWTDGAADAEALVAGADEAMYESKRARGGPVLAGAATSAAPLASGDFTTAR